MGGRISPLNKGTPIPSSFWAITTTAESNRCLYLGRKGAALRSPTDQQSNIPKWITAKQVLMDVAPRVVIAVPQESVGRESVQYGAPNKQVVVLPQSIPMVSVSPGASACNKTQLLPLTHLPRTTSRNIQLPQL
jgi:hypothetical protein